MADIPAVSNPRQTGSVSNPLEPVAWMLASVRSCLDEASDERSPRWVRISKARKFREKVPHGPVISRSVEAVLDVLAWIHHALLEVEQYLLYVDPEKAILEWVIAMARAATAPELGKAFTNLLGGETAIEEGLKEANEALTWPERFLGFIPEPADLRLLGREIFRMFEIALGDVPMKNGAVDPAIFTEDRPHATMSGTGRLRLMAWAFDFPINVRHRPGKDGSFTIIPVQRLGGRWRWPGEAAGGAPKSVRDSWPSGDEKKGVEIYKLDYSGAGDIAEVVRILDTLGYREPAFPSGNPQVISSELSTRLAMFQRINELPEHGLLDSHTLHRLLNLDVASRNVARARPFDEALFKKIPPPPPPFQQTVEKKVPYDVPVYNYKVGDPLHRGELELVNPDADHPQDEGISINDATTRRKYPHQTRPMRYYICAADPQKGFPKGISRGWLQHQAGGAWMFQNEAAKLGNCRFIALETRPLVKGGKTGEREGGALSEGASLKGEFFFAARAVEPWLAGRTGTAGEGALEPCAQPPNGTISAMYQWLDIQKYIADTNRDPKKPMALVFQGSVEIRSLYKDRGAGRLPDQGRIVIGLAKKSQMTKGYSTEFSAESFHSFAWSGLWPTNLQEDLMEAGNATMRSQDWVSLHTETLAVPLPPEGEEISHLYVGLHGVHRANLDTDAYFDHVRVSWWRVEMPEATATQGEGANKSSSSTTGGA